MKLSNAELDIIVGNIDENDSSSISEHFVALLSNPVARHGRIAFLDEFSDCEEGSLHDSFDDIVEMLRERNVVEVAFSGEISPDRMLRLCRSERGIALAFDAVSHYELVFGDNEALTETSTASPAEVRAEFAEVFGSQDPIPSGSRIDERLRAVLRRFRECCVGNAQQLNAFLTSKIFDETVDFPVIAGEGCCETEPSDQPAERRSAESFAEVTEDGLLRFRCPVERMPYGFGLLYIFDKRLKLIASAPLVPIRAGDSYRKDLHLRQCLKLSVHSELRARIVAADAQSAALFLPEMAEEYIEEAEDSAQREQIRRFFEEFESKGEDR